MNLPFSRFLQASACAALTTLCLATTAYADPPDRVARLSYMNGTVTFNPAGTQDWADATLNRPFVTGDGLWVDANSRAELNVGQAALRADAQTSVIVTNLTDHTAQFQLAQGTVILRVRAMAQNDIYEIDTPNLAFNVNQPGDYRVTVTADGQTTYALVRQGAAVVSSEAQTYTINANQSYSFTGNDLSNYTYYDPPALDAFDTFCAERDRRWDHSLSAQYVAPGMIGYEDLDNNGGWQQVDGYGAVWFPANVPADWAPYHFGHWAWISPWGWTWVDDAPWGFAPFHYGRWVHVGYGWGWVPGPVAVAPVYAPALVGFVGGPGFTIGVSTGMVGVAWFPLGPREVYQPGYEVSVGYVQRVNVSNTTVTNTYVTNVVNNTTVVNRYVNQAAPGGVTAVSSTTFASGQAVGRAAIPVNPSTLAQAKVSPVAPVAPTASAVTGAAPMASARPAPAVLQRSVVARTAPPAPPVSFAARQQALTANPGHPLPSSTLAEMQRAQPSALQARPSPRVIAAPAPPSTPAPRPAQLQGARPGVQGPAPARGAPTAAPTFNQNRPLTPTPPQGLQPAARPGQPVQQGQPRAGVQAPPGERRSEGHAEGRPDERHE